MEIVLVLAHVLGQMPDARGEQRDLYFGRPRVAILGRVFPHYLFFIHYYRQLRFSSLFRYSLNLFL